MHILMMAALNPVEAKTESLQKPFKITKADRRLALGKAPQEFGGFDHRN